MLFDLQSMFSDQQAITADAASTNQIDLGVPGTPMHAKAPITQDVGRGRPIQIVTQITQAFNNLTSMAVIVQTDNDPAFGSPKVIQTTTLLLAELVAGKRVAPFYLPQGITERYIRLFYDITGTAPSTGKVTAGLVFGEGKWSA